ncbi:MAG: response regulator transcription factor [Bdellovibrionales bacterium]|nr:response regulator transcription factor [Bdellovibrionales bacterium]
MRERKREYGELLDYEPRVLIIEDDHVAAETLNYTLVEMGCKVSLGHSVDCVRQQLKNNTFDLVILDWALEDGDAGEAILSLLADKKFQSRAKRSHYIPQRIVTISTASIDEINLSDSSSIDHIDHWEKPVLPFELQSRLLAILGCEALEAV